jgi:hypothetical protein
MGAHLDSPSNARQADKAYKQQQVYQACSKSLRFFFEIGAENTWVEVLGEEILDSGTYKPTTVMEIKKYATGDDSKLPNKNESDKIKLVCRISSNLLETFGIRLVCDA